VVSIAAKSDARQAVSSLALTGEADVCTGKKKRMPYQAIIFDLGRVLVHFDFQRGYRALEELCPYRAAEIPARLAPARLVERLETGLVEPSAFVTEFCTILGLNLDYHRFCEIWSSIFTDPLIPESLLAGLAARYRLLLLSNTNAIHFEALRQNYSMLLRHFHHFVLSHEVKAMKPDPAIYRAAIEKAGCRPQECFYTDDIPEYVAGARRAGIDAVQFESASQIERELKSRGIVW
jgi:FMN phosphatase YigB (HAD superfamily)